MGLERIVGEAASKLTSKTFGGVSKESAMEAIKAAVKAGEEAVAKVTQELQAFKGKTAQEMAELTSKNDRVILQTKAEAQAAVEAAQKQASEQVKAAKAAARAPKVFEKALPNGGKEVRKVSANGATMVKEYNAEGKLVKYSVTQLDGSIRRTTFDPITGKPVKTYTNIGGDKLIEYKEGSSSITKAVNKKKVKAEKPTLVSQTEPKRIYNSDWGHEGGYEVTRTYSDGSKEVVQKFTEGNNNRTVVRKTNAKGTQTKEKITWEDGNYRLNRYNPEKRTSENTESYDIGNGIKLITTKRSVYLPNEGVPTTTGSDYIIGKAKVTADRIKDEFGLYTDKYRIKVTYPKETGRKPVVIKAGTESDINRLQREIYNEFGKA